MKSLLMSRKEASMPKIDTLHQDHEFILDLWRYIKTHRRYTETAFPDADELLNKHSKVKYAPEMVRAYLESMEVTAK